MAIVSSRLNLFTRKARKHGPRSNEKPQYSERHAHLVSGTLHYTPRKNKVDSIEAIMNQLPNAWAMSTGSC